MARLRKEERGAALLVVMVAVTVLTALAVDLAYQTSRSLRIAANARDELRATYLAKSGVALSRLVLSFQQDVDNAAPQIPNQPSPPRPQLWNFIHVDSDLAGRLFGAGAAPAGFLGEGGGAGPPSGGFDADVSDEGTKVNVQLDALHTSPLLGAQVQALYQLICDSRWDALFDREDENGVRVTRQELLVYLRDWVDDKDVGATLDAAFPPGGCVIVPGPNPFPDGFQDENYPYDRGEDRYRTKNARMDSLAELYLVAGVTDAFVAAFGDALTVYLPRDHKQNLNTTDPARLFHLAKVVADPANQPGLYDQEFPGRLHRFVMERTLGGILSLAPSDFGQLVELAGVTVNENSLKVGSPQNPFDDRSRVFRVRALGRAGDVQKSVEVVVVFPKAVPGQPPASLPGKLVRWREE